MPVATSEGEIMTYGVVVKVPAPITAYEASHGEIMKATGGESPKGMIFHVARETDDGFEMVDVWESKQDYDKFGAEVVGPAVARAGIDVSGPQPQSVEFTPTGLMLGRQLTP